LQEVRPEPPDRGRRGGFTTTRWSLVVAAGSQDTPQAREALATLCEGYWQPIYAFLRRQGADHERARDLTQGFFSVLIEKNYVGDARRQRGRFRTFLLAALRHYVANEWARDHALKRGGGQNPISLEALQAERAELEPASQEDTPEKAFDRRWARTLLDASMERLRDEMGRASGLKRFESLLPHLTGDSETAYRDVAAAIGISEPAVKVAVHRLRRRFRAVLREEVAQTVGDASDVDEELSHLLAVLSG